VTRRPARPPTVVNLCFHGIGTPDRELEPDEEQYWVGEEQFDELLEVIRREPALRVTCDDGNASDVEIALPALKRAGLEAAFFLIAGRIGQRGSVDADGVRELARAGMTVGNHGLRHRAWRSLDEQSEREELVEARVAIAGAAGKPVDEASFPFGEYDRAALRAVRRAGYDRVFTVDGGPARLDAWLQSRHTITSAETAASLEQLARAGPGLMQTVRSTLKRWR
jgi:peptidoglycan/xylan/chitin deacetylase (PgdA/CDA1 family)